MRAPWPGGAASSGRTSRSRWPAGARSRSTSWNSLPIPDHEYRGLVASSWDLLRGDTSTWEDVPFYRQAIKTWGEPALDVGCGTGRLLLPYLADGLDADGVDISPEMLALCRARAEPMGLAPRLYSQPMEELRLPRTYRTIFVPSSSFQLVVDRALAARAMERFFAHLQPGGALVMPFMILGIPPQGSHVSEASRPDGTLVRRRAAWSYDAATQLENTEDRYELIREGAIIESETHVRTPATRSYTDTQAIALFEAAGFQVARVLSGFTQQPHVPGDELFSIVGVRP